MIIPRPFLLAILDGWGTGEPCEGNAVTLAETPVMDRLMREYPHTSLFCAGEAVGLPEGQMGNSEVGHLNIGAGRLVLQDFQRINRAIESGEFFRNAALTSAVEKARKAGGTLHLIGLLSDGGVHSHIEHLFALLQMASDAGLENVCTHALLDGRDVPPRSAVGYTTALDERVDALGIGAIRTIGGRYYGMDRDNRWERTRLAYEAIVHAEGPRAASSRDAIEKSYGEGVDDEFLLPTVIGDPVPMSEKDSVIFFNFRPDRPRQLTRALVDKEFDRFDRGGKTILPYVVTMTEYGDSFAVPSAFAPETVENTLADVLAEHGRKQLHIAETEKYAHVTYFFNGGVEEAKPGEDRVLIESPKVATYDMKPEMSAYDVAAETVRRIESGKYDFIVLNFANCDMVGHTGVLDAAVRAVEAVDRSLGLVMGSVFESGGAAFVTSDHGNAEVMLDIRDGCSPCTAHSTNTVPFVNVTEERRVLRANGALGDVAPTVLEVLQLPKPPEMTGVSLFTLL